MEFLKANFTFEGNDGYNKGNFGGYGGTYTPNRDFPINLIYTLNFQYFSHKFNVHFKSPAAFPLASQKSPHTYPPYF